MTTATGERGSMTEAVRAAGRFDRGMVSFAAGLQAAIPVVAVLGAGLALGRTVAGVTAGAGAMLVGIAWRTTGGRPPLAVMATDACVMALSTFVGCVTGSTTWLHFIVLCLWAAIGGLLVGVGNRGGAIGTQALIAVIVFGRFSEPPAQALGLAALVLTGGLAQVAFLSLVRWPPLLRAQRSATAAAYRSLATVAQTGGDSGALPAAAALDEAEQSLASPALLGDAALGTLRALVAEGYRLRVQLTAIGVLLRRQEPAAAKGRSVSAAVARDALAGTATALHAGAHAIETGDGRELELLVAEIDARIASLQDDNEDTKQSAPAEHQLRRRLAALAGQLRAVRSLAPAAGRGGGLRSRRPRGRTDHPLVALRADLEGIRGDVSLDSPVGRHALRLAVVVPLAELVARELPVPRGYWVAVAAATVLRPEFGATFTRGTERALGTCLGVALAGLITVALHPAGGVSVVIIGGLAWIGYGVFPASFALGFAFITAVVVFLINVVNPDTLAAASARLLDTLIGGAIGLAVFALWPTWARTPAWQSLAELVAAQRDYVDYLLRAIRDGSRPREQDIRTLARRARRARSTADSTVARSLSEPSARRIDGRQSREVLAASRRLVQTAHVIRLEALETDDRRPLPGLDPLRADLRSLLTGVETALLRSDPAPPPAPAPPDVRSRYLALARRCTDRPDLLEDLDELVDAANGLAVVSGVPADDD